MITGISAVTLATRDMPRAVRFYRMLGFGMRYGGEDAAFTSFRAGSGFLNLIAQPAERRWSWWGRVIFYDSEVDALYARLVAAGCRPDTAPRDAEWGERFFHITDPDGHELSFAWPLQPMAAPQPAPEHRPAGLTRGDGEREVDHATDLEPPPCPTAS